MSDSIPQEPDTPVPELEPQPPEREVLDLPDEHAAALIEDVEALQAFAAHMATCNPVAIDTEANSMHAYREQTCIMQVTAGDRSAIIDVLAVGELAAVRAALDRSHVEVIFHGGDYDITVLSRDHGFSFEKVFDTMIAATLLGDQRVGLAALVEDHFGHTLNKKYQRADWARRPLTDEQLDYLRRDTMYLPSLREHYMNRLADADLLEEAAIEFQRLATRQGKEHAFDPESWRRIKGSAKLDGRGRCILVKLFHWRERQAEKRDVPPFKVLAPQAMLALAERCKRAPRGPRDLPGLNDGLRRRYGAVLVDLVKKAFADLDAGRVPPRAVRTKLTPEEAKLVRVHRKREELLREWRKKEARKRDVPNLVVLPNPAMVWMTQERPTSVAALEASPDIGPKRIARYGEAWIKLLAKT